MSAADAEPAPSISSDFKKSIDDFQKAVEEVQRVYKGYKPPLDQLQTKLRADLANVHLDPVKVGKFLRLLQEEVFECTCRTVLVPLKYKLADVNVSDATCIFIPGPLESRTITDNQGNEEVVLVAPTTEEEFTSRKVKGKFPLKSRKMWFDMCRYIRNNIYLANIMGFFLECLPDTECSVTECMIDKATMPYLMHSADVIADMTLLQSECFVNVNKQSHCVTMNTEEMLSMQYGPVSNCVFVMTGIHMEMQAKGKAAFKNFRIAMDELCRRFINLAKQFRLSVEV